MVDVTTKSTVTHSDVTCELMDRFLWNLFPVIWETARDGNKNEFLLPTPSDKVPRVLLTDVIFFKFVTPDVQEFKLPSLWTQKQTGRRPMHITTVVRFQLKDVFERKSERERFCYFIEQVTRETTLFCWSLKTLSRNDVTWGKFQLLRCIFENCVHNHCSLRGNVQVSLSWKNRAKIVFFIVKTYKALVGWSDRKFWSFHSKKITSTSS